MKFKQFLSVVALIILISLTGCTSETGDTVNIAGNVPMTGDLSTYGASIRDGSMLAKEDLEDRYSADLSFSWQDNASQAKNAVNAMKKQFLRPVDIYVSGVKPQIMATIDQVEKKDVIHFGYLFDAFVCEKYDNLFRTLFNYKGEAELYLKYVDKVNPKSVAIIYVNFPHAEEEFQKLVIPKLKKRGISDLYVEAYDWKKKDYKDIASKTKEFGPDLIIINGFKNTIIGLIQALRSYDLIKDGNTIGTIDVLDAAEELSPQTIEGIRVVATTFNTRANNKKASDWRKNFYNKYGREPRWMDAYSYDMVNIIYDAAERLELPAKMNEWKDALLETNMEGITGHLEFDQYGDLKLSLEIGVYRNGKLEVEEGIK